MGHLYSGNGAVGAKQKRRIATNRYRYMLLVATICGTSFFIMFISRTNNQIKIYNSNYKSTEQYSVDVLKKVEGCSIPVLQPLDESVKKFVEKPNVPPCLDSAKLPLEHNQTHIWTKREFKEVNDTNKVISCCYRQFSRPAAVADVNHNVDRRVAFEICKTFSDIIDVGVNHEYVKVNCSTKKETFEQYFLFTPKKKFVTHYDGVETSSKEPAYNVLVLGIDAVSRQNLYRTMPKTIQYLKEKGAVDFSGYNKVGDNTFPNLIPMLLGISVEELNTTCLPFHSATFDNCPFIWEWYKQAGYYTAFAEDSSWLGTFNYLRAGFTRTPTDYYLHTFINEAETYMKTAKVPSKSKPFCLNDKYLYKILLQYVENLADSLHSNKLFGLIWEITMSHDYLNYPMIMDEDYVSFFENLDKTNYLNKTIIFLVSDHGIRWGKIRYTKQGRIEERLPFVFALVPPSFRNQYSEAYKNLQLNSNRLTSPYDLHATLYDLVKLQSISNHNIASRSKSSYANERGISLFLPIPTNRTCETAGISDHWCTCHMELPISKTSKEATGAASYLVAYMNSLVKDHPKCASLELAEISEATEMIVGKPDKDESHGWHEYLITIKTVPGEGMFEATVRNNSDLQWSVSGTVSRLNLYGNQSACVDDNLLKLYCYCTLDTPILLN